MATITAEPARRASGKARTVPPLENGDRLTSVEFMRRYKAMPHIKKAELIEGIVYMGSPVRADVHGEPDGLLQLWIGTYTLRYPGLKFYPNSTLLLAPDNTPQPDCMLCRPKEQGGRSWMNEDGYICGAPELVCEVAASSVAIDLHKKFRAYQRNGIAEYLVWNAEEKRARWFALDQQQYVELQETAGLLVSRVFPGLALDVQALAAADAPKLIATLQTHLAAKG